jgi:acyl dehydratase
MNQVSMEIETGAVFGFRRSFNQSDFDRFAALSGDDNPIHVNPDFAAHTKFGRTVAHGMLLYSTICGGLFRSFPNRVQITQELMFPNPTYADEQIIVRLEVLSIDREQGRTSISTTMMRPDGELGFQGQTTMADLSITRSSDLTKTKDLQPTPLQARYWKGLSLGQSASTDRIFTQADLREYVLIADDCNPLYTDTNYAKGVGFNGTPLPGGLLGGILSNLLGTQLPGRGTNWLKQKLYFHTPAYPNEKLSAQVEITRLRPEKDLVNLWTEIINPKNEVVCSGEALVLVKDLTV